MRHLTYLFLISYLLFTGCIVPVQLPRVTLTESYTQSFSFEKDENSGEKDIIKTIEKLMHTKDNKMRSLLFSNAGKEIIVPHLDAGYFIAKGIATMTFSVVPGKKPKDFYISGVGSYHIVDTTTAKVYFSANYYLVETVYPIAMLDTTSIIPVFFNQSLINHFPYDETHDVWEHNPTENVRIDLIINRSIMDKKKKPIFGLDYNAAHKISVGGKTIGYIHFRAPASPFDKIIDMRGMKSIIRRDYKKFKGIYERN